MTSTPTILPYGGGAIVQPEIVSLYWGSFTQAQITSMQTYLQNLALHISGSTAPQMQEPAVYQYGVRGARLGATYTDTSLPSNGGVSGHTTRAALAGEIASVQAGTCGSCGGQSKLPAYDPERVFMVFTNGITFDDNYGGTNGWCGEHFAAAVGQYYSVNPYPYLSTCGSAGFGSFDANGMWQSQTSHELFEAVTDPAACSGNGNPGWASGCNEIGDPCNWGNDPTNTVAMSFGAVQTVVDKLQNACSIWTKEQAPQISAVSQVVSGVTIKDLFAWSSTHSVLHRSWRSDTGWQAAWEDLGGTFTSPPVAIAGVGGPGTVDFVAQGTDNSFYHKTWTGTAWSPAGATWDTTGGNFAGQPAVTSTGANKLDVFGQGIDGSYYHIVKNGGTWSGFDSLGSATFNGGPTVVTTGSTAFHIFGRSTDGSYWYKFWNGSGVPNGTWQKPTQGLTFISEPVVAQLAPAGLDLFGQGTDWNYYHLSTTNAGTSPTWTALQALGGPYLGPPSASWQSSSLLDMVGQANDGSYNHRQEQSGTWAAADPVNGSGFGAADLLLPSFGTINLYIEGTDNQAYFKTLNGSTWSGWTGLGGSLH